MPAFAARRGAARQRRPPSGWAERLGDGAGRGFARLTALPPLAVVSWLLPGLPLLLAGDFAPVPMLLIAAPLFTALAVNVLHRIPARWPVDLAGQGPDRPWSAWFALAGTVLVAAGFTAWQLLRNSPSVIDTRGPGATFQTGFWIAQHGSLPIPASLAAFGGPHPGLQVSGVGFFAAGHAVVPASLAGLPMLLAGGFWTSGTGGGAVVAPVLGGLAVLCFGGLTGRLAGRRWAPAGALALALTLPEIYTSRDAFTEPAVQILIFGGICLVVDALTFGRSGAASGAPLAEAHAEPAARAAARAGTAAPAAAAVTGDGPVSEDAREAGEATVPAVTSALADAAMPFAAAASSMGARRARTGHDQQRHGEPGQGGPGHGEPGQGESGHGEPGQGEGAHAGTGHADSGQHGEVIMAADAAAADDATMPLPAVGAGGAAGQAGGGAAGASREPGPARNGLVRRLSARAAALGSRLRGTGWSGVVSVLRGVLTPEPMLAAAGGLSLGLTSLLSLGSLVYLVPAIAVAGVIVVARRAAGTAFCIGLAVGCGYGLAAAFLLARPLVDSLAPTLRVIGEDAGGVLLLTVAALLLRLQPRWLRLVRNAFGRRPLRWLPGVACFLLLAAIAGLAIRPYLQTVRGSLGTAEVNYVAALQRMAGLKVDPGRLYSEDSLYWVTWYAGIPTLLLGAFGAAVLLRRCLRSLLRWRDASGAALNWALPLAIAIGGSGAVLWQPFTVPDQPWASRRLVPVVIPGLIVAGIWAAAWLTRRARERGAGRATAAVAGAFCVAAMALPSVTTSFGFGLSHSGPGGGLRPIAGGLAQHRVGQGEDAAVRALCAAIGRSSSVVIVDQHAGQVFGQVIRGMCGVPAAWMPRGTPASRVDAVIGGILHSGRHAVLLGVRPSQLSAFGSATKIVDLRTTQNAHDLTQPAGAPWPARYVLWMTVASSPSTGI